MSEPDPDRPLIELREDPTERVADEDAGTASLDSTGRRWMGRTIALAVVISGTATALAAAIVFLVFEVGAPLSITLAVAAGALGGTVVAFLVAEKQDHRGQGRSRRPRR